MKPPDKVVWRKRQAGGRCQMGLYQDRYQVKKYTGSKEITVQVPGSKSITNRALLLAALSDRKCVLRGVLFSEDSRAFLDSLKALGFEIAVDEERKEVAIQGTGGRIPNKEAQVHVHSAGTAARFLTVMLAFSGGDYELEASPQMCKRPMQPLLQILEDAGVVFTWRGEPGHFPFHMKSEKISMKEVLIDTSISSQFASALLMAGGLLPDGLRVCLEGERKNGSYIQMTLSMMKQFGVIVQREDNCCIVPPCKDFGVQEYRIEPDVSGACYFYAMAPLLRTSVIVKGVFADSMQGDIRFLEAMQMLGCELRELPEGMQVDGRNLGSYPGLELSMKDYSDQTMTMAVLASFAESPTLIRGIGHIRFQETDRIHAILTELRRMGISCEEVPEEDGIRIMPGEVLPTEVETYEDHRMAMAFTLAGLKTGNIVIKNPMCCRKTFENYFDLIDHLGEN